VVIFDLLPLTEEYIENNGQNNKNKCLNICLKMSKNKQNMSGCVKCACDDENNVRKHEGFKKM